MPLVRSANMYKKLVEQRSLPQVLTILSGKSYIYKT